MAGMGISWSDILVGIAFGIPVGYIFAIAIAWIRRNRYPTAALAERSGRPV